MKKRNFLIILCLVLSTCTTLVAQVPNGINYQAILRDNSNNEIANAAIDVKFGLIIDSPAGTLIWEEQQSTLTNNFGLFSLEVGDVLAVRTGGTLANYSDIIWGANDIYLSVSIFYDGEWKDFDPQLIRSAPFALISKTAEDDDDKDSDNERIETLVLNGTSLEITEGGLTKDVDLSSLADSPFIMDVDTAILPEGKLRVGSVNPGVSNVEINVQNAINDEALFEVKRSDGQTVFAVYSEGVRIFLPTNASDKGPKGGFAIGGFDPSKNDYTEDYMWISPDSIRMYFDKTPDGKSPKGGFAIGSFDRTKTTVDEMMVVNGDSTRFYLKDPSAKGPKGGFAIGSFDRSKGDRYEYMHVSLDSTRFYITDDESVKGPKGGFAIGGFDPTKGPKQDYMRVTLDSTRIFVNDSTAGFAVANIGAGETQKFMDVTTENYFIGHESGKSVVPSGANGKYNSFLGYQAGKNTVIGRKNVALGYRAGLGNNASFNIFIGNETGLVNQGDYNLFLGHNSGIANTYGNSNVYIGYNTGKGNIYGSSNTLIGYSAGPLLGSEGSGGNNNTYIGKQTGNSNVAGERNVIIGNSSMSVNAGGSNNVMIGYQAGRNNGHEAGGETDASGNIFIGYQAGYSEYGSDKLYIENSSSGSPLIWGDFSTGAETVIVYGEFSSTSAKSTLSDVRYKKDFQPMGEVLPKLVSLNGTYFSWKKDEYPQMALRGGKQIGVIAQELELIFPELVYDTSKGFKTVDYEKLSVVLLEGIKEQQEEINRIQQELDMLKTQMNQILETNQ